MDCPGRQLLAGVGLAQQHRGIAGSNAIDHLEKSVEAGTAADHQHTAGLCAGMSDWLESLDKIAKLAVLAEGGQHFNGNVLAAPRCVVDVQDFFAVTGFSSMKVPSFNATAHSLIGYSWTATATRSGP